MTQLEVIIASVNGELHLQNETPCYVYTYTNSLTGKVFYVGKGTRNRYMQHYKEALSRNIHREPTRVVQGIRCIWQQGGKVIIRKVRNNISSWAAEEIEKKLIRYYGFEQLVNLPHYKTFQLEYAGKITDILGI